MKKYFLSACSWIAVIGGSAQNSLNIVPMPVSGSCQPGVSSSFLISRSTILSYNNISLKKEADYLVARLNSEYGISIPQKLEPVNFKKAQSTGNNKIVVTVLPKEFQGSQGEEFYNITGTTHSLQIIVNHPKGFFYAIQTLLQVFHSTSKKGEIALPAQLSVNDYPRFSYRGMHLDVGRHLFPVEFIKKYLDYLAFHKFNTFHWHLTEDQGWRIEIKKYPLLTRLGSCRDQTLVGRYGSNRYDSTKYCGFYTQDQVKEIVQYAADRYITVIPEIEMPGHSTAALASYPYLGCTKGPYKVMDTWGVLEDVYCAGNESTFTFLQDVLDEVMQLFPSTYIHIGGDECPKERWKSCPVCQKKIKDEHLKDEHALQSYFIQRIERYLNSKGRKIIGWDEILEGGLAPNATVMSWRGEEGGIAAARQNHDVVMTPGSHCYLDHSQSANEDSLTIGGYLPLEKVYSYEPIPAALNADQAKHILGAQGNVWTEYMSNPSKVEYMIFPRMSALSEVLWSQASLRNWKDFERRIPLLYKRYESWRASYSKAYFDLKATVIPSEDQNGILWKLESKDPKDKIIYLTGTEDSRTNEYIGPIKPELSNLECSAWILGDHYSRKGNTVKQIFHLNKATGKKITLVNEPHKNYPGNGAFTLVDGVQNENGLARSFEFLGFSGNDLDAMIDLKTLTGISKITLHVLDQHGSWIYLPSQVQVTYLKDMDLTAQLIKTAPIEIKNIDQLMEKGTKRIVIQSNQNCRYIHIVAKNFGLIPSGNPGAGNPAWLFADEIEVE